MLALPPLATYPLSLYGRDTLYSDGSISKHNMFNQITQEYSVGHVTAMEIRTTRHAAKARHLILGYNHYGVTIGLTTTDGKTYYFSSHDFRNNKRLDWLNQMLRIKSYFPAQFITYDRTYIDYLSTQYNMTEEETTLLYQLFNME